MPGPLGRDAIPERISRHVQVARAGGVVKIAIDPSLWWYLLGLGIELFMAGYGIYCGSDIFFDTEMASGVRIGRSILFVMLLPVFIFIAPAWLWVLREVITLSPEALCLRREWWRFGHTSRFDINKVRNIRVEEVEFDGYRHTIKFDHDLAEGVGESLGKDLELDEAHTVVKIIQEWQRKPSEPAA